MRAAPFEVLPGEDRTVCSYVRAENDDPVDVQAITTSQAPGGHHIIVYAVDHAIDLDPHLCTQGGQPGWDTLAVSQQQTETLQFEYGTALRIRPRQQFVIETHFINASDKAVDATGSLTLKLVEDGAVNEPLATFYFGTMNIDIAPLSTGSSEGSCMPPINMEVLTMIGHQHRFGTRLSASVVPGGGEEQDIYLSTQWESAPLTRWQDGLEITTEDRLRVVCEWDNTSGDTLRYPREMCFVLGYYRGDTGFTCVSGGGGPAEQCTCFARGNLDVGDGGGAVELAVSRTADVPGAGGPLDQGDGIYCFLYAPEDVTPQGPNPDARPQYFSDAQGIVLKGADDQAIVTFPDVTPGAYVGLCMMDVVGGGFVIGSGDVINANPAIIAAGTDKPVQVQVTLDFAIP